MWGGLKIEINGMSTHNLQSSPEREINIENAPREEILLKLFHEISLLIQNFLFPII